MFNKHCFLELVSQVTKSLEKKLCSFFFLFSFGLLHSKSFQNKLIFFFSLSNVAQDLLDTYLLGTSIGDGT